MNTNPSTHVADTLPEASLDRLESTRTEAHPFCFACGGSNPMGLALRPKINADGSVTASFLGHPALEGYSGSLHGGVIATLLDGVMTHCLFARGVLGMTVELCVRYHVPITAAEPISAHAWIEGSRRQVYQLRAELLQNSEVKATATAKFMPRHE